MAYRKEKAGDVAAYRAAYHAKRLSKEPHSQHNAITGSIYSPESSSMVTLAVRALVETPTASIVAFATACRDDCRQARQLLEGLATQAVPVML